MKVMIDPTGGEVLQMVPVSAASGKLFIVNFLAFPGNAVHHLRLGRLSPA